MVMVASLAAVLPECAFAALNSAVPVPVPPVVKKLKSGSDVGTAPAVTLVKKNIASITVANVATKRCVFIGRESFLPFRVFCVVGFRFENWNAGKKRRRVVLIGLLLAPYSLEREALGSAIYRLAGFMS
jgi:hypothetical protein